MSDRHAHPTTEVEIENDTTETPQRSEIEELLFDTEEVTFYNQDRGFLHVRRTDDNYNGDLNRHTIGRLHDLGFLVKGTSEDGSMRFGHNSTHDF